MAAQARLAGAQVRLLGVAPDRQEAIAQARKGLRAAREKREAALADLIDALHEIIHNLMSVGPGAAQNETAAMNAT